MELVLATRNRDKLREFVDLLADLDVSLCSLQDYPDLEPVIEDGKTLEENAVKKASRIAAATHQLTLADDSGLEVAKLSSRPGVISARFAGEEASYAQNNQKLLSLLEGVPPGGRDACFRCCVAIADSSGLIEVVQGSIRGWIAETPRGSHGFGYDPVFIVPRYGKTFAELDPAVKNRISHRARAVRKAKRVIAEYLQRVQTASP